MPIPRRLSHGPYEVAPNPLDRADMQQRASPTARCRSRQMLNDCLRKLQMSLDSDLSTYSEISIANSVRTPQWNASRRRRLQAHLQIV